jgi:hypothetical protein
MHALDRLIPCPDLVETDWVTIAAPPDQVWDRVRHGVLGETLLTRALFALRTLGEPRRAVRPPSGVRLDAMRSSPEAPGFQVLIDDPPSEVAVGAIGKVWRIRIPFVHVPDAHTYAAFAAPGLVKVAWALRVRRLADDCSRLDVEVRVAATSDEAWGRFRRYFRVIGPGSRYIRRTMLRGIAREMERSTRAPLTPVSHGADS